MKAARFGVFDVGRKCQTVVHFWSEILACPVIFDVLSIDADDIVFRDPPLGEDAILCLLRVDGDVQDIYHVFPVELHGERYWFLKFGGYC